MKRVITSVVLIISFVSLLVLGLVSRVQAEDCSNNSLKGTYGASCEGAIVGGPLAGPVAVVGVLTADGDGNISGVETLSVNGVITIGVPPYGHLYRECGLHRLYSDYCTRRRCHRPRFGD
jgi:hypothetical protein